MFARLFSGGWVPLRFFALTLTIHVTLLSVASAATPPPLPHTKPLEMEGDLSAQMVAGLDVFLSRETEKSISDRARHWRRDFSSREAYEQSVTPNRERLARIIGVVDRRRPFTDLELVGGVRGSAPLAATDLYKVLVVRWPVLDGVHGEGLLLQPKRPNGVSVVAIPDADQTPEMLAGLEPGIPLASQFARRLAENGCLVVIPVLIDRKDTWSGNARLKRFTNQPHREWIYRQAYEMGRHVIGYEVQKVLALVDWFAQAQVKKIGVAGYGEGGLIGFYAAALDSRIETTLVSGYFQSRQGVWSEPIYRNVFGLLDEFGDAEIASLIGPRVLLVEYSEVPAVTGPPVQRDGRSGAAPGKLSTPDQFAVESEITRLKAMFPATSAVLPSVRLFNGAEGSPLAPGSPLAVLEFLATSGLSRAAAVAPQPVPKAAGMLPDSSERQRRQVKEAEEFTQRLLRESEDVRREFFWRKLQGAEIDSARSALRSNLWEEVIGRFTNPTLPAQPRTREIHDTAKWKGYDVVLDIWPDVFAWGVLLLPKDLKPGERRPVVVCQHGLEGVPADTITDQPKESGYRYYAAFSARLAEAGFVVFAPHNPYRGQDNFRVLQRKANPLKKSLFSVITAQHAAILDWLAQQPFVDAERIGFYGLSYGGKTAMRVPALLDRYALSICSADFNEWIKKNVTVDSTYSYMFTGEYEMPEFNLGHTFNYAEMAALIAPRPFMVERGHRDGVAPDEWVAYEFAKVRRHYADLKKPERTEIEFFDGPHTIHGVGTFDFLKRHMRWTGRGSE